MEHEAERKKKTVGAIFNDFGFQYLVPGTSEGVRFPSISSRLVGGGSKGGKAPSAVSPLQYIKIVLAQI